jgi:hypothetical protein
MAVLTLELVVFINAFSVSAENAVLRNNTLCLTGNNRLREGTTFKMLRDHLRESLRQSQKSTSNVHVNILENYTFLTC